jgi:hypothetical protein
MRPTADVFRPLTSRRPGPGTCHPARTRVRRRRHRRRRRPPYDASLCCARRCALRKNQHVIAPRPSLSASSSIQRPRGHSHNCECDPRISPSQVIRFLSRVSGDGGRRRREEAAGDGGGGVQGAEGGRGGRRLRARVAAARQGLLPRPGKQRLASHGERTLRLGSRLLCARHGGLICVRAFSGSEGDGEERAGGGGGGHDGGQGAGGGDRRGGGQEEAARLIADG